MAHDHNPHPLKELLEKINSTTDDKIKLGLSYVLTSIVIQSSVEINNVFVFAYNNKICRQLLLNLEVFKKCLDHSRQKYVKEGQLSEKANRILTIWENLYHLYSLAISDDNNLNIDLLRENLDIYAFSINNLPQAEIFVNIISVYKAKLEIPMSQGKVNDAITKYQESRNDKTLQPTIENLTLKAVDEQLVNFMTSTDETKRKKFAAIIENNSLLDAKIFYAIARLL